MNYYFFSIIHKDHFSNYRICYMLKIYSQSSISNPTWCESKSTYLMCKQRHLNSTSIAILVQSALGHSNPSVPSLVIDAAVLEPFQPSSGIHMLSLFKAIISHLHNSLYSLLSLFLFFFWREKTTVLLLSKAT